MTAITTNGIGQRTTSHLNLTRTMADVWRDKERWSNAKWARRQRELQAAEKVADAVRDGEL